MTKEHRELELERVLLTNGNQREMSPEYTMVDGMLHLEDRLIDQRTERTVQVAKFRGSDFLSGRSRVRLAPARRAHAR